MAIKSEYRKLAARRVRAKTETEGKLAISVFESHGKQLAI